jgi:aminopeptidase N
MSSQISPGSVWQRGIVVMLLLTVFTLSVSPLTVIAARPQQPQTSTRQELPTRRYIPAHDYDMRHIKLDLRFDWEREQTLGTATITFAPLVEDFRQIELDAANMTFASVQSAYGATLPFAFDQKAEKLRVTLDRAYKPAEELTIQIKYNTLGTLPGNGIPGFGQGLAFIKPTKTEPGRPRQIWSQGESNYNHTWFPCWDHPNDFATSEMIATVERPFTVISNGRLIETRDNPDQTRTFHWRMEQPHASYLTSIIVGEYASVEMSWDGIPITTYVYPNELQEGRTTAARTPEMVRFFSERTGVRYPYAKYAQTMVRDFGGGMENITATTLTDQIVHDRRTALDRTEDSLISHELAHQWFGNYVTCRTWADIWLNESFATYFQAMWTEHSLGRDDFLYADVKGNQDQYFAAWEHGQRRPIVTSYYKSADDLFDVYAYPRGGAVLHMLRATLGEENWRRAIRHYLKKHAHQPVETAQLRVAIEEATGQPMDWFFQQWIYQMGHPVLRVTKSYDEATKTLRLSVRQEQKLDPNSPYPQTTYFRLPVNVAIETKAGTRVERIVVAAQEEQTFTFETNGAPLLVNFDQGGTLIKELRFEKPLAELVYQLGNDRDVLGRVRALDELIKKANDNSATVSEREEVARALSRSATADNFWGVRLEAVQRLRGAQFPFVREAWLTATKDANSRVRAASLAALATTNDASLARVYESFLNDASYSVIRQAALALAETKDAAAYERLTRLVNTPSWRNQIRTAGIEALAVLNTAKEGAAKGAAASRP